MTTFLDQPSRYLFFTGKGGVGKTALACAAAIRLADAGKRILLVSTDLASNLDEMLGVALSNRPTPIPGAEGLWALNIDPEKAADDYRERVISPYRAVWTEAQLGELREQLAGACTVEIAAFDEFAEQLAGDRDSVPFDHVLFDTAPTGHPLRLLSLPRAWTGFLQSATQGASGSGLIMVMGKGGVGKTTIAAAIAAELASRGHQVHLSTTDPAAHMAATLDGAVENLTMSRIDPVAQTRAYVDRVMATRSAKLDEEGRALLAEDLRSPCYEEVAVFAAFSRIVSQARSTFVVLDTAPTGHTLLLLDTTGSYHRQVVGTDPDLTGVSARLVTPLMRLQDPVYTKILLVTLAETTPVSEAARLQADLRRVQIEPFGWVINSSLAVAGSADPCLRQRMGAELQQIEIVRAQHATRMAIVPWEPAEPVGPDRLLALAR